MVRHRKHPKTKKKKCCLILTEASINQTDGPFNVPLRLRQGCSPSIGGFHRARGFPRTKVSDKLDVRKVVSMIFHATKQQ